MHDYQAIDVTQKAKEVIKQYPTERTDESLTPLSTFHLASSIERPYRKFLLRESLGCL